MLTNLLRKTFGLLAVQTVPPLTSIPASTVPFPAPHEEPLDAPLFDGKPIPIWPPGRLGVPAAKPEVLLGTQRVLIESIRNTLSINAADFERLIQPIFLRFASYVHLLPASESAHHCGQGGLLRHSFEVAFYAAKLSCASIFGLELVRENRRRVQPKWVLASMLAGLLHDTGKILTDIACWDQTETRRWRSKAMPLSYWLEQEALTHYYLTWVERRGTRDTSFSSSLMQTIIGMEVSAYLDDDDAPEIFEQMHACLQGSADPTNLIARFVKQADQFSTEEDLKRQAKDHAGTENAARKSAAARILAYMRSLLANGKRGINQPGSPVLYGEHGVFLRHPEGIYQALAACGVQALKVNNSPARVSELFDGFQFTQVYRNPSRMVFPAWHICATYKAPDGRTADAACLALRMASVEMLLGSTPLPPPMKIKTLVVTLESSDAPAPAGAMPTPTTAPLPLELPSAQGAPAGRGAQAAPSLAEGLHQALPPNPSASATAKGTRTQAPKRQSRGPLAVTVKRSEDAGKPEAALPRAGSTPGEVRPADVAAADAPRHPSLAPPPPHPHEMFDNTARYIRGQVHRLAVAAAGGRTPASLTPGQMDQVLREGYVELKRRSPRLTSQEYSAALRSPVNGLLVAMPEPCVEPKLRYNLLYMPEA